MIEVDRQRPTRPNMSKIVFLSTLLFALAAAHPVDVTTSVERASERAPTMSPIFAIADSIKQKVIHLPPRPPKRCRILYRRRGKCCRRCLRCGSFLSKPRCPKKCVRSRLCKQKKPVLDRPTKPYIKPKDKKPGKPKSIWERLHGRLGTRRTFYRIGKSGCCVRCTRLEKPLRKWTSCPHECYPARLCR